MGGFQNQSSVRLRLQRLGQRHLPFYRIVAAHRRSKRDGKFYEILGSLGVGAMGEVYRAKDTRLDREVAIKVLPEHFAEDEERLRRFEREAKSLASLNHPNVAQIFGVDQVEDPCFLVLELMPGREVPPELSTEQLLEITRGFYASLQSHFQPTLESVERHPSFHKTDSLDYLVVLSGRLTMLLDDDEQVTLEPGDVVVQQGVMHGWRVEGDEPVRLFAVMIDGAAAK